MEKAIILQVTISHISLHYNYMNVCYIMYVHWAIIYIHNMYIVNTGGVCTCTYNIDLETYSCWTSNSSEG